MKSSPKKVILTITFILAAFTACKDKWEDHNALREGVLSENLVQFINSNSSLSIFSGYLKQTGYDKVLELSKAFTVWAPNNEALSNLDLSIVNDTAKLKKFVANHISYQEYPTNQGGKTIKIKMLSGKNITYVSDASQIDGAAIVTASSNLYCKNGLLHVITSPLYPKDNIWEYFKRTTGDDMQKNIMSYVAQVFDEVNSRQTGFNFHGEPIYDTVWAYKNIFLMDVNDVSNEDSAYTFFVLTDAAFQQEYDKMKPYLNDTSSFSSDNIDYYTRKDVCKDIVIRGKYTPENLPKVLTSTKGISIPMDSLTIESHFEASNGIVYTVSRFNIPLTNKITSVKVEGENYFGTYGYAADNSLTYTNVPILGIRARSWASGGMDLFIPGGTNGHRIANLSVGYYFPILYTLPYKVFWVAVNDFQSSSFTQKLAVNPGNLGDIQATTYQGDTVVSLKTVNRNNFSEVQLGQIVNHQYGHLRLFVATNSSATTSPNNPIVLDYIKLVPVLP
jgi:uncharacterized surface protein with fasciclin (FAS1) repeats